MPRPVADIAVIGGSGFYSFLHDAATHSVRTPYGDPSAPVAVGDVGGRRVAFLPRHGLDHEHAPHTINYRANAWALRSLGVRQVLAPCAVGSLQAELGPGDVVVPDQLVDRTSGREHTFAASGAVHVPFADPYCARMRRALTETDPTLVEGGTMVVIPGPRFSTRAESMHLAGQGWSLIGMTGQPEASLAREMRQCYAPVALVTDRDAGLEQGSGVDQSEVFAVFARNIERLKALLADAIAAMPDPEGCACSTWADDVALTYEVP